MDRLTVKDNSGAYHLKACQACTGNIPSKKVLVKVLGAYEDTGMTPEEIERMKHDYFDVVVERDRLKGAVYDKEDLCL